MSALSAASVTVRAAAPVATVAQKSMKARGVETTAAGVELRRAADSATELLPAEWES